MSIQKHIWCEIVFTILVLMLGYSLPSESTQTEIWTTGTFKEFQQGKFEQVSLANNGTLSLAPKSEVILTLKENDFLIWALVEDSQGNLYVGTGEEGKIFKISPNREVSLFFDSPEIGIISLAVDAEDNIYAGSAPDGLVYKITPEGSAMTFFMTDEHYVWALVFGTNNILYAGTGESGKIFRILPDGSGSVLYDSSQTHVMSLVYDLQKGLYAGTEGKGLTYNIDAEGQAFALYQAKEEEIHSLALDSNGNLYLAALSNRVYPKVQEQAPSEQQPVPKEKSLKHSTIYRISPQGTVLRLLELPETLIYAMIVDENDYLFIGTDNEGILYRMLPNGDFYQMLKLDAEIVLALLRNSEGDLYLGTGDAGSVYHLSSQFVEQGHYLSKVYDAGTVATWGRIFWKGTPQQISLFTRTGNTAIPDDTWSQWSEALQNNEGEAIPNPSARFIQWKAVLSPQEQQNPVLEEVSIAYLPHNLPPDIEKIAAFHASQSDQRESTNTSSRNSKTSSTTTRVSQADSRESTTPLKPPKNIPGGHVAVLWKATDPNDEELIYMVALRGEQEKSWNVLEEELDAPRYLLDTTTLPDGSYYIKITAGDSPNNPPAQALQTEKMSERFEVDNTAPKISIALNQKQDNGNVLVIVIAQDELSRLKDAEYSIDAKDWTSIFPDDQVADSRDEKYSIALSDLEHGEHVLMFKAADTFDNIGVGKIQFSTPETVAQQESK